MRVIDRLRGLSRRRPPRRAPPFFAMLERRGLTYAEVETAIGADAIPRAMRRCIDCRARYACGWRNAGCLNGQLFTAAARNKSVPAV
jgi:hypothetical protein